MKQVKKRARSGVIFDCETCGKLLRENCGHNPMFEEPCVACGASSLVLVGAGTSLVQLAKWYRCSNCRALYMFRRGELVRTGDRAGFKEYT